MNFFNFNFYVCSINDLTCTIIFETDNYDLCSYYFITLITLLGLNPGLSFPRIFLIAENVIDWK